MDKKFFYAVSVLVGSMVGVGIFGLPYAFVQSGFWTGMVLLVCIGCATLLVDFMFGEVILRTHAQHQILGYAKIYLHPIHQKILFFSTVLLAYVSLLAYIVISGDFLNTLLSPFFYAPSTTYSVLFAIVLSLVALKSIKTISQIELLFMCLFLVVTAIIFVMGFRSINPQNFLGIHQTNAGIPYGVLLFAFGGLLGIPFQRRILAGEERKLRYAIILAVMGTGIMYALFTTIVVGISGLATTPDAVSGLFQFIGGNILVLTSIFGIFAISTSFLMLAAGLINTFYLDLNVKKFNAWLLVVLPPFILFIAGLRSFIGIISLAGGVALALEQIIVVFLYAKAKEKGDRLPEYSLNIPVWLLYILIGVFSLGVIYFLFVQ
jgi:tyrosine-specific transport protein